jgi:RING finger protein 113A
LIESYTIDQDSPSPNVLYTGTRSHTLHPNFSTHRMFRKPKRKAKDALRKKDEDEEEDQQVGHTESSTNELVAEARQRLTGKSLSDRADSAVVAKDAAATVMHTFQANQQSARNALRDLVTSTAEHHPSEKTIAETSSTTNSDGIFRGDQVRNKFHAGPIRAAAHVRVTARFDYQPDICKDYKETGFCGFGDTCIYLHDRGDTVSGWQLEQQWEEEQKRKKAKQEQEMNDFATGKVSSAASDGTITVTDDDIPFACHLCRGPFKNPVATRCLHYFCEACIMNHVRTVSEACPICNKDTGSVFNLPTKLLAKKRKLLGGQRSNDDDDLWEQYLQMFQGETADR